MNWKWLIHVHDCLIKKQEIEHGLKEENGFVKNLKCISHEMLTGPIEEGHVVFYPWWFPKELSLHAESVFLEVESLTRWSANVPWFSTAKLLLIWGSLKVTDKPVLMVSDITTNLYSKLALTKDY